MSGTSTPTEAELARRIAVMVRDRLPTSWQVKESFGGSRTKMQPHVEMNLRAADDRMLRLVVLIRRSVDRRDISAIAGHARLLAERADGVPIVGSAYLSPSVREGLTEDGLSYADATGNLRIVADAPALFISDRGQDRDPWRQGRPRGTLKGEPAARVTRALLDFNRSWRVRELIACSGASVGATYRVLDYLEREALVTRNKDRFSLTDWERLLRQWSDQAPFTSATRSATFIEPRGAEYFLNKVSVADRVTLAVTGSFAASQWAPYAPAKAAFVYVSSIEDVARLGQLRSNDVAPNVILLEPGSADAFQFVNRVSSRNGYPVAAPAQVAADLLNGPGREPAEGDHLIAWMKDNETVWRHA